jgi:predicted TIM-barrel fold metal-dependent hydrolase
VIVDVHTHFLDAEKHLAPIVYEDLCRGGFDPKTWQFSAEQHLEATRAADVAVVFGLRAAATGWQVPNDAVAEQVARAPDRLVFFASVDPGEPGFLDELRRCHQDLGCQGVKLSPIYQGVHPLDKRYCEIYRYCQAHGLPVMTHMATTFSSGTPLDYARPAHMDQVSVDFPDLKIVLAHMGHPWEGEAIAVIRKQPNVYADLSALYYRPWQFYNTMQLLVEYHAEQKVLFGSDFPAATTADSLVGVRNVNRVLGQSGLPAIPEAVLEGILHRDALACLGIPGPQPRGTR